MTGASKPENESIGRLFVWLAALFLVVLGAKLWVIQLFGTDVPYWDQWDETRMLFQPWLNGHLTWNNLFEPHNEHRIFFTRLLDMFQIWLNGQWDPRLQMVVNALIHISLLAMLAYIIWRFTGQKYSALICAALIPFAALPFDGENTMEGFQSQMYLLSIWSILAIVGLGFARPGSAGWFGGLLAAVMALFTMGSGLLASLAVLGLMVLRGLKQKRVTKNEIITGVCALVIFAVGASLSVSAEADKEFRAHSVLDFLAAFMGNLAWPFRHRPPMLFVVCLPLAIVFVKYLQSELKNPAAAEFALAFALWGMLQAAGLALARTSLGDNSRYMDTLSTVPIASVMCWFILAQQFDFRPWLRTGVLLVWVVLLIFEMVQVSRPIAVHFLPWLRVLEIVQVENIRVFEHTDKPADLALHRTVYWNPDVLAGMLRDPHVLGILPPEVRPALKLEPATNSDAAFVAGGYPAEKPPQSCTLAWGNHSTNGVVTGRFTSEPLTSTLPELLIPVCFDPGPEGISVKLVEEATGKKIEVPLKTVGHWQILTVPAPQGRFRVQITDTNPKSWVAVGEIKEAGRLTIWAEAVTDHALVILVTGLCMVIGLTGCRVICCYHQKETGSLAGVVILLVATAGLAVTWHWRDVTGRQVTIDDHKTMAAEYAAKGDTGEAARHLQDALWLQPDDPATLKTLQQLPRGTIVRQPAPLK